MVKKKIRDFSFLIIFMVFLLLVLLIQPWGNFPLNDDWQYSALTKNLSENGLFILNEIPVAPALIGQSLIGTAAIQIFGFSHTLLRVITLVLSICCLALVNEILKIATIAKWIRVCCGLILVTNPIFMNLSNSFMTEIYGYFFSLFSVFIWFKGIQPQQSGPPLISWRGCLLAATLAGTSALK